jgi:hypothetical protein
MLALPARHYFWGSLLILLVASFAMQAQIGDRQSFAGSELHADVRERWGAPISQAAPSVRYVESGAVFNTLRPLGLDRQIVRLDADMNYRKRGLVYFSGFDFVFSGQYRVTNPEPFAVDVVFVFPVQHERTTMISDLSFEVDGEPEPLPLSETHDRLVWTGRLARGESAELGIRFRGRGLDSFTYFADPELPVRDLVLDIQIAGGDNYDYGAGVLPATRVDRAEDNRVALHWEFASLEAGFPFGVILPSERSYDSIILTMIRRSWASFVLFFAAITGLALYRERPLARYDAYLLAATYAFFFVLLPYLAAYMHFYLAYLLSLAVICGLLQLYLVRTLGAEAALPCAGLLVGLLVLPTLAVILQSYTGLIYSLEILAGLALLMTLTRRTEIRRLLDGLAASLDPTENAHAH